MAAAPDRKRGRSESAPGPRPRQTRERESRSQEGRQQERRFGWLHLSDRAYDDFELAVSTVTRNRDNPESPRRRSGNPRKRVRTGRTVAGKAALTSGLGGPPAFRYAKRDDETFTADGPRVSPAIHWRRFRERQGKGRSNNAKESVSAAMMEGRLKNSDASVKTQVM